ncbi:MAG: hypothetical protein SWO11_05300 [Thermodesulfobacteriota bacterium]|nr:hypothetical protein [Thermodesulfobacteriota bacterium]
MKLKLRDCLFLCIAIPFLFSLVTCGCSSSPHPIARPQKHPPGKPYVFKVHPKHHSPIHKRGAYILAPLPCRPIPPGPRYVWIPRYRHHSGVYIGGYWRPQSKPNFIWVEGYWNAQGEWVFGYWKPVKVKPGHVWVPGYWDGTLWVEGYWRPERKPNHIWIPGHYSTHGLWIKGYWKLCP